MNGQAVIKRNKSKSLATQIKDTERRVLTHRQGLRVGTTRLLEHLHQQLTAPSTLLLAAGVGFLLSEVTKRQNGSAQLSPLLAALNTLLSIHTLCTSVPMAWLKAVGLKKASDGPL